MPKYYEFFAGGGMVRAGLGSRWKCLFANDIDPDKVRTYADNWGDGQILEGDIHDLRIKHLPRGADLAWASFPCQDLSCAGNGLGIGDAAGDLRTRSGTFWPFIGLMKDLKAQSRPPKVIVLENVPGLLSTNDGEEFKAVVSALTKLNYRTGAVVLDARHFVPQSRARVFIIAVSKRTRVPPKLSSAKPQDVWHPDILVKAVKRLPSKTRQQWVWFNLGPAPSRKRSLNRVVSDYPSGVTWHSQVETRRLTAMMSDLQKNKLLKAQKSGARRVGTLSLRMRPHNGQTVQRAEICFDGLASCLRTPKGGGSRPRVVIVRGNAVKTRLLSPKEAATLMGLSPAYKLPVPYETAFRVIGDGVVVPAVSFIRDRLLNPLVITIKKALPASGKVRRKRLRNIVPRKHLAPALAQDNGAPRAMRV